MSGQQDQHQSQRIAIAVDFYDDDEKKKLEEYPRAAEILALVSKPLLVPLAEFLTYYLFYRKRPGKEGYRNYEEISNKVSKALVDLEDFVDVGAGSVCVARGSGPTITAITERIGESIGLSVVNRIHGLHEADWDKIPTHPGPRGFATFDYLTSEPQSASDGAAIVQVEAKGAAGEDPAKLAASVRTQATKAKAKKVDVAAKEASGTYKYPASVRYATIAAVGVDIPARCWLLDPPADMLGSPAALRIINRVHYLTDLVSFISPRSQLAAAARTRLWALAELRDPAELTGVPLIRSNGRPFELDPFDGVSRRHGFFRNMSHVVDGPVGGVTSQTHSGGMLFIGVREDLVSLLMEQDYDRIVSYGFPSGTVRKEVECVFSPARARDLRLPEGAEIGSEDAYVRFHLEGTLHYSPGGMVFGVLPLDSFIRKRQLRRS